MANFEVFVLGIRQLVGNTWTMQCATDYPSDWTDVSEQLDAEVQGIPVFIARGVVPQTARDALTGNASYMVLAYRELDGEGRPLEGGLENFSSTITSTQTTALRNWITARGIDLTKYNITAAQITGQTRQAVIQKMVTWLRRRVA